MRDRIRPPRLPEEDVLEKLKEDRVFETKQKAMMFAAAVGFALHRREVEGAEFELFGEPIRLGVFLEDEGFIDALAVAIRGDLAVMAPERQTERIELFERCTFLGLKELKRACYDERPEYPLNGVLNLLDLVRRVGTDELPGLEGIL